jgi:uncharacterized membrane protein
MLLCSNLEYNLTNMGAPRSKILMALQEPANVLFKLVGIPLICSIPLFVAALYVLGGAGLIRYALSQLTWKVAFKVLCGIVALALLVWIRHITWYRDEAPPLWWRRSTWLNLLEILVLLALILIAIWAIPRFA